MAETYTTTKDAEESPKMTDEQLKALKRQVSGVPDSLFTATPVKPETDAEKQKAEQQKVEPTKPAEQPKII